MSQFERIYRYYIWRVIIMAKRKIYASKLIKTKDFYHLAKEFYKYIYRYPELEKKNEWKELKEYAEDFLVAWHQLHTADIDNDKYRDFLRFYTKLETKYYDEERNFIFTDEERMFFFSILKTVTHK